MASDGDGDKLSLFSVNILFVSEIHIGALALIKDKLFFKTLI
jgi:hypothetical protein